MEKCMKEKGIIVIRGGGDLATGTAHCLHSCGYRVLVLEVKEPSAIRRSVSFCEAVYDGETVVEGVKAVLCCKTAEIYKVWHQGDLPIIVDPEAEILKFLPAFCFVDAAIAKKNLGTHKNMADFVLALGPGFTAGEDADVVIETQRGHRLGRIIKRGAAAANTGIPGIIAGYGKERVIHSENAGVMTNVAKIGDLVTQGDLIAKIDDVPVYASISGVLRGLLRQGYEVTEHFKIADIDPRLSEKDNCYTISDKARTIAGGVLQAILMYECGRL